MGKEAVVAVKILSQRSAKGLLEVIIPNGTTLQIPFTINAQGLYEIKLKFEAHGSWIIKAKVYESEYFKESSTEAKVLVIAGRLPPNILELILALIVLAYLESGGLIYDLSILTFILPQVAVACILVTTLDQFTESIVSKLEKSGLSTQCGFTEQ